MAEFSRRTAILAATEALLPRSLPAAVKFSVRTLEGDLLDNASLRGRSVLVQFWATWCNFCQSDEGAVEAIGKKFGPRGLTVIAVNAYEPRATVQLYLAKHPRSCRIALLAETNLAPLLTARSYPMYVLLDRGGAVAGKKNGAAGEPALRGFLQRAGL